MRTIGVPGGETRDLSSLTNRSIGRLKTPNQTATSRFVARMFCPAAVEKPSQGTSGWTKAKRATTMHSSPPT